MVATQVLLNTTSTQTALAAPVAKPSFGIGSLTVPATPIISVVTPVLNIALAVSVSTIQAKDTVHATITITAPSSPSPGYDVDITSLIPSDLHLVAGSLAISGASYTGLAVNSGNSTNSNVDVGAVRLMPAGSVVVEFDLLVDAQVLANKTIPLPANLAYCSAPLAQGRACYTASTSQVLRVPPPTQTFVILSTSLPDTDGSSVTIGERITYQANITYPKGDAIASQVAITVPLSTAKQQVLSATVTFIGSALQTTLTVGTLGSISDTNGDSVNDKVVFSLPSLWNDPDNKAAAYGSVITVQIETLMTNASTNNNQVTGTTASVLTYNAIPYTNNIVTTVVLPNLSISKTASAPSYVQTSSVISYTITVQHTGTSKSPAYTLSITDLIPSTLVVSGNVQTSFGTATVTPTSQGTTIQITGSEYISGSQIVITYNTIVTYAALSSAFLVNNVSAVYFSAPSDSYNTNNIRQFESDAAASVVVAAPAISFIVGEATTSFPETPDLNVAIGETITVPVQIVIPRGVTKSAQVSVALPYTPGKLQALSGVIAYMPPNATSTLSQGAAGMIYFSECINHFIYVYF